MNFKKTKKKLIFLVSLLLIVGICMQMFVLPAMPVSAASIYSNGNSSSLGKVEITTGTWNVRSGPSSSYSVLAYISGYTWVDYYQTYQNGGQWVRLSNGWVGPAGICNYDNAPPYCSSTQICSNSHTGYDVYVYGVGDATSGVNTVRFPTWTKPNQSDIRWDSGTNLGGGTWKYHVDYSLWGYATSGYYTAVYGYDNAGNISAFSGNMAINLDYSASSAPTTINTNWSGWSTNSSVAITGISGSTDSGTYPSGVSYYQYELNGGSWTNYSGTPYLTLSEGSNSIGARAVDNAGNVSSPYYISIGKDTTGPTMPNSISTSWTGWSNNKTVTINSIIGSTDIGGSGVVYYQYQLNGGSWTTLSGTPSITLTEGLNTISAKAVDNDGNVSSTYSITIGSDNTAPTTPTAITTSWTGWSKNQTVSITGISGSSDSGSGVSYYQYQLNGGTWTNYTGTASLTLVQGLNTISARAVDSAGNISTAYSTTVGYDSITPTAPTAVNLNWTGWSTNGTVKINSISGSTDSGGSGIANYQYQLNGGTWVTLSGTATLTLLQGSSTINVRAVNNVGTVSPSYTVTVGMDTTGPSIPTAINLTAGTGITNGWTSSRTVNLNSITGSTDSGSGVACYQYQLNNGLWTTLSGSTVLTLTEGSNIINARAVDNVGNLSPVLTMSVGSDTTPPTKPNAINTNWSGASTNKTVVISGITGSTDDGSGIAYYQYQLDNGTWTVFSGTPTLNLTEGSNTINTRAVDKVGNTSDVLSLTLMSDTTPPSAPTSVTTSWGGWNKIKTVDLDGIFGSIDSGSGVASYQYQLNSGSWVAFAGTTTLTLNEGINTINTRSIDNVGNISPTYTVILGSDTTPPTVPSGLSLQDITDNSATLSWNTSTDSGSGMAYYNIYRNGALVGTSVNTSFTDKGLSQGTSYTYTVAAVDVVGNISAQCGSISAAAITDLPMAPGSFSNSATDMSINSVGISVSFARTYSSLNNNNGPFGRGWTFSYSSSCKPYQYTEINADSTITTMTMPSIQVVTLPDGSTETFKLVSGGYVDPNTRDTLAQNSDGTFTLIANDKTAYTFTSGYLTSIKDKNGNTENISVDANGNVQSVTDTAGRTYTIAYSNGLISSITDPIGRTVQYGYTNGNLTSVKDPMGITLESYAYDSSNYLTGITDAEGNTAQSATYDHNADADNGKIISATDSKDQATTYAYNDTNNTVTLTDSSNNQTVETYNSNNQIISVQDSTGTTTTTYNNAIDDINTVTDASGNTTQYHYDGNGNVTQMTKSDGTVENYTYDISNNQLTSQDSKGNMTYFIYDSNGNVIVKAQPINGTDVYSLSADQTKFNITKYTYNSNGTVSAMTSIDGATESYIYDQYGNVIKTTNSATGVTRCIYDSIGRLIQQINPAQYISADDGLNNSTPVNTYSDSNVGERYTYDNDANVLTHIDSQNNVTTNTYNSYGKLIKSVTGSDETRYVYNANGWLIQQINPTQYNAVNDGLNSSTPTDTYSDNTVGDRYTYDAYGNVLTHTDINNNNTTNTYDSKSHLLKSVTGSKVTRYVYDSSGKLIQQIYPDEYSAAFDGLNNSTPADTYSDQTVGDRYTYDSKENVLTHIDSNNITSSYIYDNNNKVIKFTYGSNVTRYIYNNNGKLIQQINPNQYVASEDGLNNSIPINTYSGSTAGDRYTYDANGNMLTHTDPANNVMYYTYDVNNNLIKTVCNNEITRNVYNANNKIAQKIYPNQYNAADDGLNNATPVNTYSDNTVGERYNYDGNGNTLTYTDSNNNVTYYTYDSNNNLIKSVCNNKVTRYIYDSKGKLIQQINPDQYVAAYDGLPSANTYSDSTVGDRYTYDANGKVLTHTDENNNVTSSVYDADGNVLTETQPNGAVYTYDNITRKVSTESYSNGLTNTINYNDDGSINSITGNNGVSTQYGYDGNGNMSQYTFTVGSNVKSSAYTYDGSGNIHTISESGNQKVKYYYDLSNQPVREDNVWLNETIAYSYDTDGNILTKTVYPYTTADLSGVTATYTYNYQYGNSSDKDQLTSYDGNSITYDANGNVQTYNGWAFAWTNNQLTGATNSGNTIAYQYNSDGIRTQKTVNGITTTYTINGSQILAETNGTNTKKYTYDSNGKPVLMTLNGTTYAYELNSQGDVVGLLDSNNNEVVTYQYDTWGKLVSIKDGSGNDRTNDSSFIGYINPLRYRGYYYDTETGLYYLQSRYYNPELGRFVSPDDPSNCHDNSLISINLYDYCNNNPSNEKDSSGKDAIWITNANAVAFGPGNVKMSMGHTSLLLQDNSGNWYFFYWGPLHGAPVDTKYVVFQQVNLNGVYSIWSFNSRYPTIAGGKYTFSTYIWGNFTNSITYAKNLKNNLLTGGLYSVLTNNCMQVSISVLLQGVFKQGNVFPTRLQLQAVSHVIIPNMAAQLVAGIFGNTFF